MCALETEWLFQNGDVGAGDDVKGGERMEEGGGRRVVGMRAGTETHFTVELSSGEMVHCTLPQVYTNIAGVLN